MTGTLLLAAAALLAVALVLLARGKRNPQNSYDYLREGDRALDGGDTRRAAELYLEAIRLDHMNLKARCRLAEVAWQLGDFDNVIEHLRDCQRWLPEDPIIESALGAAESRRGNSDAAIRHYLRAIELAPRDRRHREALARLYDQTGRGAEAEAICPGYAPQTPEEELARRIWDQLGARAQAGIERWESAERVMWRLTRIARACYLAFLALALLAWALRLLGKPIHVPLPPRYGTALGVLSLMPFALAVLSVLGLRIARALAGSAVRRMLLQSGVAEEEVDVVAPAAEGPPWWRVETSGFHALLWLALPILILGWPRANHWPWWAVATLLLLSVAWLCKAGVWLMLLLDPQGARIRQYRWFGTRRSALVALALIGGIEVLLWIAIATSEHRWPAQVICAAMAGGRPLPPSRTPLGMWNKLLWCGGSTPALHTLLL